jgi:hypothetical protein
MAGKFTQEELENLTPEELAGMEDDELVDEGEPEELADGEKTEADEAVAEADEAEKAAKAALEAESGKAKSAEEAAAEEGDEKDEKLGPTDAALAATAAAEAARKATEAAKGGAKTDGEETDAEEEDAGPRVPNWQVPADLKQRQEAIDAGKRDLKTKFDEGEIDSDDYAAGLDKLNDQKTELDRAITKAQIGDEMRIDNYVNVTVPAFLKEYPAYKPGSALHRMLDGKVRELQETSDNPLSPKILRQAHEAIVADFKESGIDFTGGKVAGDPKPKPSPKRLVTAKSGEREPPPVLRNLPASDGADVRENEFARLDRLFDDDPLQYQEALDKLEKTNPEAYERYMQAP